MDMCPVGALFLPGRGPSAAAVGPGLLLLHLRPVLCAGLPLFPLEPAAVLAVVSGRDQISAQKKGPLARGPFLHG